MPLGLITCDVNHVHNVTSDSNVSDYYDFQSENSDIVIGLGKLSGSHTIHSCDNVKPTSLHSPYKVPLPHLLTVKKQLDDMENKGVISRVTVATDSCAGMVQVLSMIQTKLVSVLISHI